MNDERLDHLIHRHLDGALSAEEAAEFDALVRSSPAARERFWELARIHALMREWGSETWGRESGAKDEKVVRFSPKPDRRWLPAALAAAAAIVLGAGAWWFAQRPAQDGAPIAETDVIENDDDSAEMENVAPASIAPSGPAAAVLTRTAGVEWSAGEPVRSPGAVLPPGMLRLERGVAQIEFNCGARVILEGPAEFEIVSDYEARCHFGKLTANVPEQAHGFKVVTPNMTVLDLGTAFACDVPRSGIADVHVLEGRVSLWTGLVSGAERTKGQAVRESGGQIEGIAFRPEGFITPQQLAQRAGAEAGRRHTEWKEAVRPLDSDPATLVHYTFEDQNAWDGVLMNRAAQASPGTHAGIVGAAWTGGRWPGKGALEFKGASDRVRLQVPGEHRAATFLAWVRVDSLPNATHSLLAAVQSGFGATNWEITGGGGLSFEVRAARGRVPVHFYGGVSTDAITALNRGEWIHLATTYDVDAGVITHYVNGQPAGTVQPKKLAPLVLSELELGNWALSPAARKSWPASRPIPQREFIGRMDELAIVARAMSADEIAAHYKTGRP